MLPHRWKKKGAAFGWLRAVPLFFENLVKCLFGRAETKEPRRGVGRSFLVEKLLPCFFHSLGTDDEGFGKKWLSSRMSARNGKMRQKVGSECGISALCR